MGNLKVGDLAPEIKSKDQNGKEFKLSDLKGKKVVLYFYPKDDTPGCTKQACNLRDNYSELQKNGYEVIGVSADKEAKHQKFIDKYDLPFTLLADEEKEVIQAYDAWGLKKFMGKEYMGIIRKTFVIDEDGTVELAQYNVKATGHVAKLRRDLGLD